jgi:hypothetical protein
MEFPHFIKTTHNKYIFKNFKNRGLLVLVKRGEIVITSRSSLEEFYKEV